MSQMYKKKSNGNSKGIMYKNTGGSNNTINGKTFVPQTTKGRTIYIVRNKDDDDK